MSTCKSISLKSAFFVIGPIILAWGGLAAAPLWNVMFFWEHDYRYPNLPLVALPPGATVDVRSSVPGLFVTLMIGGLSALCVEVSKVRIRGRRRGLTFLVLVAYQFALMAEALRAYAQDWWVWLLSWLGFVDLSAVDWHKLFVPIPSPWLGLVWAAVASACIWLLEGEGLQVRREKVRGTSR